MKLLTIFKSMGGISTFEKQIFELRMDLNKATSYLCAEIHTRFAYDNVLFLFR